MQVVVVTCRPGDYAAADKLVSWVDVEKKIRRLPRMLLVSRSVSVPTQPASIGVAPVPKAAAVESEAPGAPSFSAPPQDAPPMPPPVRIDDSTYLAALLREAVRELGMSNQDVAAAVSAGTRVVQLWLDGKPEPAGQYRERMAKMFGDGAPDGSARARVGEVGVGARRDSV